MLSTFLCGADGATTCATCHPSCLACTTTPDTCDSCSLADAAAKSADGAFCVRTGVTVWDGVSYFKLACVGCDFCIGTNPQICVSEELAAFVGKLEASYSLPLTDEANGLICFRQPVPDLTCDPLTPILGELDAGNTGSLHPTADQCYKLLNTLWPFVTYWFGEMFPNFNPPGTSTKVEKSMLKTVLWLWILQYGPSQLKTNAEWQGIVTTFNNASLDWTKVLAWAGATTGYSPNGSTKLNFPAVLVTSLTQTSPEMQLFNYFSTLCASACILGAECQQISTSNMCS